MTAHRLVALLALVLVLVPLSACSAMGESRKERMLSSGIAGGDVQLITLRVTDRQYGRLTVEQTIVDLLSRREGILDVQRGSGREELYVLAEAFVDPYSIPRTAPERFIVRVVSVEKPEHDMP